MSRVSQEELYNDKDVVTQILKLKDTVNDYAGGIIENIDVSGNDLVIDWVDGTSISLPLPSPTGISSVTGTVSGGNLTITFYMTDGSSHAFTCPLTGMATEAYVDGLDAQNVKLTGAQSVAGVKTFTDSPVVPDSPATEHSAVAQTWAENVVYSDDTVNNLLHKEGNETRKGQLTLEGPAYDQSVKIKNPNAALGENSGCPMLVWTDKNNTVIAALRARLNGDGTSALEVVVKNSNGTDKSSNVLAGDVI